jgi:demethylmenaquinone methyltransferase/2-methoxy-6-polyprenyl-1,4-benzoquinol methylase
MTLSTAPRRAPTSHVEIDKSDGRVRKMFGEIAPRYDLLNHLLSLNVDRYWRRRTVQIVPPQTTGPLAEAPILDLCTGTGDLALAYYRAAKGKVAVVGADFCPEMLELAKPKGERVRASLQQPGPATLEWHEADTQQLPFATDTYQIVSVAFGLRNVADTDRGLAEMVRVCRPGGKIAVLEFTTPRRQPLKGLYGAYFRHVLPRIGQLLMRNNSAAYEYLPQSVREFLQYEALAERMTFAGLRHVTFHPLTFGLATLYVGEK